MTDEQQAAYVRAMTVCAIAEIEAMKVENRERESLGLSPAYKYDDFMKVPEQNQIHHNQVIGMFYRLE